MLINISFNAGSDFGGLGNSFARNRRSKFGIGSLLLALIISVVFSGAGFYMAKSISIDPHWTQVRGTITAAGKRIDGIGGV